jgi:signal transduction histidine kinase
MERIPHDTRASARDHAVGAGSAGRDPITWDRVQRIVDGQLDQSGVNVVSDQSTEPGAGEPKADGRRADEARAARRIIEAGDAARGRLARDLHDGAQQQFILCAQHLQLAQQDWTSDPERARTHVDAALEQVDAGRMMLRELVGGIHPPILTHLGLGPAVEALAATLPIPVGLDLTEQRVARAIEASMYFFISEALTNVIKHARATGVDVRTAVDDAVLTIEVRDDGVGGAQMIDGGVGLTGLQDRVDALDGELIMTSPRRVGTTLLAQIPVSPGDLL